MKAELISKHRVQIDDRSAIEWVIWKVPEPVPPSEHSFKYRMVYLIDGVRVVGFDNERGKGDHRHVGGEEFPYTFVSAEQLKRDFIQEVEQWNAR